MVEESGKRRTKLTGLRSPDTRTRRASPGWLSRGDGGTCAIGQGSTQNSLLSTVYTLYYLSNDMNCATAEPVSRTRRGTRERVGRGSETRAPIPHLPVACITSVSVSYHHHLPSHSLVLCCCSECSLARYDNGTVAFGDSTLT